MVYYYNGAYFQDTPNIPVTDRGFNLGDGCFTTLSIKNNTAIHLKDHIDRLNNHLKYLHIPFMLDYNHYKIIGEQLCNMTDYNNGVMRITISRGVASQRGLATTQNITPTILVALSPAPDTKANILNACISPIKRNHTSPLSQIKSLSSYLDHILALEYAKEQSCNEALFFNFKNEACCFTIGNLLVETHDENWLSPPPSSGCLAGITLKHLPQKIVYTPIVHDMLKNAKNIYRTNSVSGVVKVTLKNTL